MRTYRQADGQTMGMKCHNAFSKFANAKIYKIYKYTDAF